MNRKLLLFFLVVAISIGPEGNARIAKGWRYQEMFDKADLVVIARRITTRDTEERSTILTHAVIGVLTDFQIYLVLKGDKSIQTVQLHHYRLASDSEKLTTANGPSLITFDWEHPTFLLFLTKQPDGRYAPVSGQEDPADFSVLELRGGAD